MNVAKRAAFDFKDYEVSEFSFKKPEFVNSVDSFSIGFAPSGIFYSKKSEFLMILAFNASYESEVDKTEVTVINLVLRATFTFDQNLSLHEIPDYFYRNSLGIIYPYLRAFVSTITFQANLKPPMILPLFNLTELERSFRENVKEEVTDSI